MSESKENEPTSKELQLANLGLRHPEKYPEGTFPDYEEQDLEDDGINWPHHEGEFTE